MSVIHSQVDIRSDDYKQNAAHNAALASELRGRLVVAREGGSPAARERHRSRGKLLVRDRIEQLLDPDTAFTRHEKPVAKLRRQRCIMRRVPFVVVATNVDLRMNDRHSSIT